MAATVIRAITNSAVTGRVHALCIEALARLGDTDPVREARVHAQLVATSNAFVLDQEHLGALSEIDDAEATFLRLQARRAELLDAHHRVIREDRRCRGRAGQAHGHRRVSVLGSSLADGRVRSAR
jgi:hypothetical protein